MTRILLAIVVLAAAPVVSLAGDTVVRLTVRPTAAPKPALRYQLLPEIQELNQGNAVQGYLKYFGEQRIFFFSTGSVAQRTRFQSLPLAELPEKELNHYGGSALRQADWAARLAVADWEMLQPIQEEGLDVQLPAITNMQILATALHVRFRGEIARRCFDDAIRTAKTMFALARHLGEYPAEIGNYMGLSIAELALGALEEMVQQPGCPNLYWALTDLPLPLVEVRKGVQGNRALVALELRSLHDHAPMSEAQLERIVSRLTGTLGFARQQVGYSPRSLRAELKMLVNNPGSVRAARVRLVETGVAKDLVEKFPLAQVILLDEKHGYEIERDERMKLLGLTPPQIDAVAAIGKRGAGGNGIFADLLPHVAQLRRGQAHLEQHIGILRHIEALRMYAAAHDDRLPETQTDIGVPLSADPFTGNPFQYTADGFTAHLRAGDAIRYDVTIRR